MSKPILCVDFDGVIHAYTGGWKGADVIPDPPVPGAIQWLRKATEFWDVQIYSSRSNQKAGITAMRRWLQEVSAHEFKDVSFLNNITFPDHKPAALLTIDDRAVCFHGNFDAIDPQELLNFKPWNFKPWNKK